MESIINEALTTLKEGGVILYPSDTIPGLGCDATNEAAVNKVFEIKNRPENKSLIILVSSDAMLQRYVAEVPEVAWDILDYADKPTTIIYSNGKNLPKNCLAADDSIGIRIVKTGYLNKLIHKLGKPLVSTSANFSNEPSPKTMEEIPQSLADKVDFIVNLPSESKNKASAIIKLEVNGEFKIIRK
jgi:L-threonylcarbamoyladenylate synthase